MTRGTDRVERQNRFIVVRLSSKTSGYRFEVRESSCKGHVRTRLFLHSEYEAWIEVPGQVVGSDTITLGERHLDCHLNNHDRERYTSNVGKWVQCR